MNLYGLHAPRFDRWGMLPSRAEQMRAAFRGQLTALRSSLGSQAVHRARRAAKMDPPDTITAESIARQRDRNRAKRARRAGR